MCLDLYQQRARTWPVLILACAIFLPAFPFSAFALDPHKNITQYVHDVWRQERGLPINHVTRIVQSKDGYLWFGMLEGLGRFDGVRFELFDKRNTKELYNNLIWELLAAKDGSLWIGTFGGGLTRYRDGKFTHYGKEEGLADNIIISLFEDHQGRIWIGTRDGGLSCFENGRFKTYSSQQGLIHHTVNVLFQDNQNGIWIGTDGGLCSLERGSLKCHVLPLNNEVLSLSQDNSGDIWVGTDGAGINILSQENIWIMDSLKNSHVECLLKDHAGNIWIATEEGVYRWKNGELRNYGASLTRVHLLYEDRDGNIWTASANGLGRIAGNTVSFLNQENGLAGNGINSIMEDVEGSLWIGTSTGVSRLRDGKFLTYTKQEGLSTDDVGPIYEDDEKNLWIGTNRGGLNLYKDGAFSVSHNKDLSGWAILALWKDREGILWVGSSNGLFRIHKNRKEYFLEQDGLPDRTVRALYQDSNGAVWIGTSGGLARWNKGSFIAYTVLQGLSNPVVRFIFEDSKHNLWIGTDGGLNLFQDGHFRVFAEKDGLSGIVLRAIHEDENGNLWIGTVGGGLFRFQHGKFTNITSKQGLPEDTIFQILEDHRSNLWMSSNKGIFSIPRKELENMTGGKIRESEIRFYNRSDGMKSSDCRSAVYPPGWKTSDGHLWFPTDAGFIRIDPSRIPENRIPPPVVVEKMIADDKKVDPFGSSLQPGTEKLEFHYTALSFVAPEKVRFRYFLEGFDSHWTNAGSRRAAFYTHIPPGSYSFKVIACNNDGIWNTKGASFSFYLQPHFYQTAWFYALCAIAAGLLALGLHSLRLKQVHSRFSAVLTERNRISREIHDSLSQSFTAISLHLKVAEEEIPKDQKEARRHVEWARTLARDSQIEARRFLQDLRPQLLQQNDLPDAMKQTINEMVSGVPVVSTFLVHGTIRKLENRFEDHLLRIAQEAVMNSIKHAQAKCIEVVLAYNSKSISLIVKDDGKGFDTAAEIGSGRFGLRSMSERIEEMGGKILIQSERGKGTTVTVEMPDASVSHSK